MVNKRGTVERIVAYSIVVTFEALYSNSVASIQGISVPITAQFLFSIAYRLYFSKAG